MSVWLVRHSFELQLCQLCSYCLTAPKPTIFALLSDSEAQNANYISPLPLKSMLGAVSGACQRDGGCLEEKERAFPLPGFISLWQQVNHHEPNAGEQWWLTLLH